MLIKKYLKTAPFGTEYDHYDVAKKFPILVRMDKPYYLRTINLHFDKSDSLVGFSANELRHVEIWPGYPWRKNSWRHLNEEE